MTAPDRGRSERVRAEGAAPVGEVAAEAPVNTLPVDELRVCRGEDGRVRVDPTRAGWRYLTVEAGAFGPQPFPLSLPGHEACVVVVGGGGATAVGPAGEQIVLDPRPSPFEALPSAVYVPQSEGWSVVPEPDRSGASVTLALAWAPRSGRTEVAREPILIRPEDVAVETRGGGSMTRQISHVIDPDFPADRLIVVEVLTPGGNWSSWPPHKHDVDDMPSEAVLEEVYLYGFRRPEAWGVQRLYRRPEHEPGGPRDGVWAVRDGDLVIVTDGYHPFAAIAGDDAWYLNALAGDRRTLACSFDPDLDFIRAEWAAMGPDPRIPLVPGRKTVGAAF
ncbi:MAG TPA: 5-deoxy-glucuronate isomerase [Candidatus Limnocylindrales bacterium]|nr:5-deoxy-glucuronate isomerase [Candidatus Limnocylindrales bacterium]